MGQNTSCPRSRRPDLAAAPRVSAELRRVPSICVKAEGLQVGDSESKGFWKAFTGSLKECDLTGDKLVVGDAQVGLNKAIRRMFQGCLSRVNQVNGLRQSG